MRHAKSLTLSLALLAVAGCAGVPQPEKGLSNIYGTVVARPHKAYMAKYPAGRTYDGAAVRSTGADAASTMIDYGALDDIYVVMSTPGKAAPAVHELVALPDGMFPGALAIAMGDSVRVVNKTRLTLTFFISGQNTDYFDEMPPLAPGAEGVVAVRAEGLLELRADENANFVAPILSGKDFLVRRVKSGDEYAFMNVPPGPYHLTFWYWRLGRLDSDVTAIANQSVRKDAVLAVDTLVP